MICAECGKEIAPIALEVLKMPHGVQVYLHGYECAEAWTNRHIRDGLDEMHVPE